jgi:hypothetical protein
MCGWRGMKVKCGETYQFTNIRAHLKFHPLAVQAVYHYVESTTFGIGHMLFYVVATSWERIHIPFLGLGVPGLARICPATDLDIAWPHPFFLGDAEVTRMSQSLSGNISRPGIAS